MGGTEASNVTGLGSVNCIDGTITNCLFIKLLMLQLHLTTAIHAELVMPLPQLYQHAQPIPPMLIVECYLLMAHAANVSQVIIGMVLYADLQLLSQFYQLCLWLF